MNHLKQNELPMKSTCSFIFIHKSRLRESSNAEVYCFCFVNKCEKNQASWNHLEKHLTKYADMGLWKLYLSFHEYCTTELNKVYPYSRKLIVS